MAIKNYDMKAVETDQSTNYTSFGWVCSKKDIPEDLKLKTKKPTVLMKRREEYGMNPIISSNQAEYEKLYKKNNKGKGGKTACAVIFGILVGILMLVFVAYGLFNVAYGLSHHVEKIGELLGEPLQKVVEITDGIEILGTIDGKLEVIKTTIEGIDGLPEILDFNVILGAVLTVLGIVFIIIFASICKMSKRQKKRAAAIETAVETAKAEVLRMRKTNVSLMTKAQRKQYMWESIITNSLINARAPIAEKDEDDDADDDF